MLAGDLRARALFRKTPRQVGYLAVERERKGNTKPAQQLDQPQERGWKGKTRLVFRQEMARAKLAGPIWLLQEDEGEGNQQRKEG